MAEETKSETVDNNNIWDDTLLIKAYDNSVKLGREELAKRIASSTNKKLRMEKLNRSANSESDSIENEDSREDSEIVDFKEGDYARATYDDGFDYEAKILQIHEKGMCLLKYIGYDNEQEVPLCDLVPSWGKKARRAQFLQAKQTAQETRVGEELFNRNEKKKKSSNSRFRRISSNVIPQPPPMPPMPPMLGQNYNAENSEHLSAMLMSWYLSGYYTGIYQGANLCKTSSKGKK